MSGSCHPLYSSLSMPPGRQRTTAGGSASYCSTLSREMLTFVLVLVAVGGASHGVSSASSRVSPAGGAGHPLSAVEDPTHLSPAQILTTNNPIQVPLGRRYSLVPGRDLAIQVRPGDRCTVTVLGDTDRLAMRPGRLWPSSFPCSFLPDSVTYTHLGGRQPNEDRVRLQVRVTLIPARSCIGCFLLFFQFLNMVRVQLWSSNVTVFFKYYLI